MATRSDGPNSPGSGSPAPVSGGLRTVAAVFVIAAIATAALLAWRRSHAATNETVVRAVTAIPSAPSHHLVLLAEARPFASVTLYAKVSGYLKWIGVDKGDHVKADQVIAIVESPETDAAWSAATADHAQKALTASRLKQLLDKKFASQEETDLAAADEAVAREKLESLTQQREFEKLKVPFKGTVTARFADPGALVQNAASSQTSALPVVTVPRVVVCWTPAWFSPFQVKVCAPAPFGASPPVHTVLPLESATVALMVAGCVAVLNCQVALPFCSWAVASVALTVLPTRPTAPTRPPPVF